MNSDKWTHKARYKKGAFLNVVNPNIAEWEADLRWLEGLPSRQHVEVWLEYIPVREERTALREMLSGTEVIVHGPFIHTSLVTHLETLASLSSETYGEAIECAEIIGAKVVTLHAGTYPFFETRETALARLARKFSDFVSLGTPIVALENMPVKEGTTREALANLEDLELLKSMMPEVHFTLDIGHSLQNQDDYASFLMRHHESVVNIHLHDGLPNRRSHLALGMGLLDLAGFLRVLRQVNYSRYISLETISHEDTKASWSVWLDVESSIRIARTR